MKNWLSKLIGRSLDGRSEVSNPEQFAAVPFEEELSGGIAVPHRVQIIEQLHAACCRQLELLQAALGLKTAALLWTGPGPEQIVLYGVASTAERLLAGPFPLGAGVTGGLKQHTELILTPLRPSSPVIPYYPNHDGTGGFLGIRLNVASSQEANASYGILCLDRSKTDPWTESELRQAHLTAQQLCANVAMARQLFDSDRERHAYQRAFDGVRRLNASLGLNSAFAATADAIRAIVPADFLAISLADKEQHHLAYVEGENSDRLLGQAFPLEQGLVGQVLKYARTLPDDADYHGTSPVFSPAHLFADYRSLMIVPLCREAGVASGALIVAAKGVRVFSRTCREMLELLAAQVAIKIDLAYLHETINRMATVDALTGIANRRAYQRGFEAMLDRARRREGALYLILCDIDFFKRINDRYGHPFGDQVLQQVAKLFDAVVRSVDLAARTGGEEFAILIEDADENGAWKVAERLRKLVENLELDFQGQRVGVTISLGIAAFPQDAGSMEKLVSCADKALYQAKHNGRNRTVLWCDIADLQRLAD